VRIIYLLNIFCPYIQQKETEFLLHKISLRNIYNFDKKIVEFEEIFNLCFFDLIFLIVFKLKLSFHLQYLKSLLKINLRKFENSPDET
jgi:hypothetical protein